jgi:hypothetical protein
MAYHRQYLGRCQEQFSCWTGATADGETYNYGGGVFFINHDFYFYTGKNFLEVRRGFRGTVVPPLLGSTKDTAKKTLGEPKNTSEKDDLWYFDRPYGGLYAEFDEKKGLVETMDAHYENCDKVMSWRVSE